MPSGMDHFPPPQPAEEEPNRAAADYDVFVSYNRQDAAQVDMLATRLAEEAGLRVWLDREQLQPGQAWRDEIERDMQRCGAALIVWGPNELGPIQLEERGLAYAIRDARRQAGGDFLVLYVLLPDTPPPQGTWANVDTWIRFEGSLDEPDHFAALVAALKGESPAAESQPQLPDQPAPYRGLADFGVGDARFFFGRSGYIQEIRERLHHHPFLAILGPSGSGKTSLVQAGFLAEIQSAPASGSTLRAGPVIRPGPEPLRSLATGLARLQPQSDILTAGDTLYRRLQENPADLPAICQALLEPDSRVVLTLDRLEELFTLGERENESERQAFADAVTALAGHPHRPALVLITMRADFYGHVARYPALADLVVNHQLYLRPMQEHEVAEAIEKPAVEVGAYFEKGLAAQLGSDAEVRGEVALPLLQHALDLLWQKRRGRWLTWDAYGEIGGAAGALRYHADRVIEAQGPREREVARRLFARLVWLEEGAGTMLAGRRIEKTPLVEQFSDPGVAEQVLQALADKRLIVLRGEGEQATAELIHDTLPLHWERLRQWVREDQEFLLWRQRLQAALAEYVHSNRDKESLLHGTALKEAERWLAKKADELTPDEMAFIARGVAERRREHRRIIAAVSGAFLTLAIFAVTSFWQLIDTEHQRRMARMGHLVAQAELARNQRADLLPHSVLLAVESMNPEGGSGSSWLPAPTLYPIRALGLWLHGEMRRLEAGQTLRAGLSLLPRPLWQRLEEEWVTALAYSPDGRHVASALGKEVCLWRAEGGEKVKCLPHGAKVSAIAYASDGSRLATASKNSVHLWQLESGERVTLPDSDSRVSAMAYSPDGTYLAVAAGETVRLWRTATAEVTAASLPHEAGVTAVAFTPDGEYLATASGNRVHLWQPAEAKEVITPLAHEQGVNAVTFSPVDNFLATGSNDRTARIWELEIDQRTAREVTRVEHGVEGGASAITPGVELQPSGDVLDVAFSPDGNRFASAGADGTARIWSRESGRELSRIVQQGIPEVVAFSPDRRHLATAGTDGFAIWEANRGGEVTRMAHGHSVTGVAFSPDGTHLATTTSGDPIVRVWDTAAGDKKPTRLNHEDAVRSMAFSVDSMSLTTIGKGGVLRRWELAEAEEKVSRLEIGNGATSMALSPDAAYLAMAGGDFTVRVQRTSGGEAGPPLPHDSEVMAMAFDPSGEYLATVGEAPQEDAFRIGVWEVAGGREMVRIRQQPGGPVSAIGLGPDGGLFAIAADDLMVRVWETGSGGEIMQLPHDDTVAAIAFSPGGEHIATTGGGSARIWEIAGRREVARIPIGQGINAISFSPTNAGHLAVAGTDGVVRVLLWRPQELIDDACARLTRNFTRIEWQRYFVDEPYREICPKLPLPAGPE